jgi:ATP-dependent NAD(P)H-hydrate dehydratase
MQSCARIAFELAKEMDQLGVVVDADGLWLVQVGSSFEEESMI